MSARKLSTRATGLIWYKIGPTDWRADVADGHWIIFKSSSLFRGRRSYTIMFKAKGARKFRVRRGLPRLKDAKIQAGTREWAKGGRDLGGM